MAMKSAHNRYQIEEDEDNTTAHDSPSQPTTNASNNKHNEYTFTPINNHGFSNNHHHSNGIHDDGLYDDTPTSSPASSEPPSPEVSRRTPLKRSELEQKLKQRQHADILVARNILRGSPTSSPRISASQMELRWQQTSDMLGAHLRNKKDGSWLKNQGILKEKEEQQESWTSKLQSVQTGLLLRSPRGDLVKRGVLQREATAETFEEYVSGTSSPPSFLRSISHPNFTSPPPARRAPATPANGTPKPTPPLLSPTVPFNRSHSPPPPRRRKGSKPIPYTHSPHIPPRIEEVQESTGSIDLPRPIELSGSTEVILHDITSPQQGKNGRLVKKLDGEAGIPSMCYAEHVWIAYRSGVVLARSDEAYEEVEQLRKQKPSPIWVLLSVGTQVWCGYSTGILEVWDGATGEVIKSTQSTHEGGITSMCYIPASQQVWVGGSDAGISVWRTEDITCMCTANYHHGGAVKAIALCANRVWTVADEALVWEIPTNEEIQPPIRVYIGEGVLSMVAMLSSSVSVAQDAQHSQLSSIPTFPAIWAGMADGTIRVLDSSNSALPQMTKILEGHSSSVNVLTAAGTHVWSASSDKTIRIWHSKTYACMATLTGHGAGIYALTLAGMRVWSAASDRSTRVWFTSGVQEIIADVLAATRATCSDLDVKARKQEEKLVQADAESKRLHEEVEVLHHKIRLQLGEASKLRHEAEILASEASAVEDWKNKARLLQAVFSSELAAMQEEVEHLEEAVEKRDADCHSLTEQLAEQEKMLLRARGERLRAEEELRRSRDWASHEMDELRQTAERAKSELVESRTSRLGKDHDVLEAYEALKSENALLHHLLKASSKLSQPEDPQSRTPQPTPRRRLSIGSGTPPVIAVSPSAPSSVTTTPNMSRNNSVVTLSASLLSPTASFSSPAISINPTNNTINTTTNNNVNNNIVVLENNNNNETDDEFITDLITKLEMKHTRRVALQSKIDSLFADINEIKNKKKGSATPTTTPTTPTATTTTTAAKAATLNVNSNTTTNKTNATANKTTNNKTNTRIETLKNLILQAIPLLLALKQIATTKLIKLKSTTPKKLQQMKYKFLSKLQQLQQLQQRNNKNNNNIYFYSGIIVIFCILFLFLVFYVFSSSGTVS